MVPVDRLKPCIKCFLFVCLFVCFFKAVERLTVSVTLNYVQYELMMSNNLASVDVFFHTHKIPTVQEQCLF